MFHIIDSIVTNYKYNNSFHFIMFYAWSPLAFLVYRL